MSGNVQSIQVANNTTPIVIVARSAQLIGVEGFNNGTGALYLKLYDAASGVAAGQTSPAPKVRYQIAGAAAANQEVEMISQPSEPTLFLNGITLVATTDYADSGTTAPAASTFTVNVYWK